MRPAPTAPSKWTEPARRLRSLNSLAAATRRYLYRRYWLRVHVFMIALLTLGGLWLASTVFMHSGVASLGLRYALALPVAYGFYLLLLRLWAQWLAWRENPLLDAGEAGLDLLDLDVSGLPSSGRGASSPDGDSAEGLAKLADGAGSLLGDADEGIVFAVPLAVVLGLVALLAGLLGTGVFMLFGVEALVAVTVEVALASLAGSLAYKGFTEGWLASALRHTGRGFIAAWVLSVLLGCGVDHWVPAAQSLPQALRMLHVGQ